MAGSVAPAGKGSEPVTVPPGGCWASGHAYSVATETCRLGKWRALRAQPAAVINVDRVNDTGQPTLFRTNAVIDTEIRDLP